MWCYVYRVNQPIMQIQWPGIILLTKIFGLMLGAAAAENINTDTQMQRRLHGATEHASTEHGSSSLSTPFEVLLEGLGVCRSNVSPVLQYFKHCPP